MVKRLSDVPLGAAVSANNPNSLKLLELLLERRANPSIVDEKGQTLDGMVKEALKKGQANLAAAKEAERKPYLEESIARYQAMSDAIAAAIARSSGLSTKIDPGTQSSKPVAGQDKGPGPFEGIS